MFTTDDYNKCTGQTLDANIKQKGLIEKSEISGFINNAGLDKKIVATLATKSELKVEQDKIIKLQVFDTSYFQGKSYFENYGTQNC